MAIARPVTRTIISSVDFGVPVADRINAIDPQVTALQPGPWNAITVFQNGWSNYDGAAPAGRYLKWRREANAVIRWAGVLRVPGGSMAEAASSPVCDIPTGARPSAAPMFICGQQIGTCQVEANNGTMLQVVARPGICQLFVFMDFSYAAFS